MSQPDPSTAPKSLTRKLAEVMKAVARVPKHGRNEFHKYDYATEADIVAAIRGELADRHVMLIPGITGRTREAVGEKGMILTHLDMTFTFFDGESGEEITRAWLGAGTDKEDKGAYKAMTGGEKYFLLKTFLIPTGDDPETETGHQPTPNVASVQTHTTSTVMDSNELPPGPADDAVYVAQVEAKSGTSKTGKPYTKYTITDSNGVTYGTFSESIAKLANECRANKTPVLINFETTKFGNDLTELLMAVSA